jgi:nicotinic acid mononucleotide adenylyltransferase
VRGCYPGSFDPLTIAHLAIADAAVAACGLDRLDLVLSRVALAKESGHDAPLEDRVAAIERVAAGGRSWLGAVVTDARLVADIADGYDVCVLGADKWAQLLDVAFYDGSAARRDDALARLPRLVVAPRPGFPVPARDDVVVLDVDAALGEVSSTAVRDGRDDWRA